MSSRTKGDRSEADAVAAFERAGYVCHRAVKTGRWIGGRYVSQANDIWGMADICAVKRGAPLVFVQVTTDSGVYARRRKLGDWLEANAGMARWALLRRKTRPGRTSVWAGQWWEHGGGWTSSRVAETPLGALEMDGETTPRPPCPPEDRARG